MHKIVAIGQKLNMSLSHSYAKVPELFIVFLVWLIFPQQTNITGGVAVAFGVSIFMIGMITIMNSITLLLHIKHPYVRYHLCSIIAAWIVASSAFHYIPGAENLGAWWVHIILFPPIFITLWAVWRRGDERCFACPDRPNCVERNYDECE